MTLEAPGRPRGSPGPWSFTLFTAGASPLALQAEDALRRLCERYVPGEYDIRVVDVTDPSTEPPLDILAVPTVVRTSPLPERRVVGDLSATRKAAFGLGLTDSPTGPSDHG